MNYLAEIKFTPNLNCDSKNELSLFAEKLTATSLVGQQHLHTSTHYVDDIYYRWIVEKLDIKLYWDDDEDNKIIIEIISFEQDVTNVANNVCNFFNNLQEVKELNFAFFNEA